MKLDGGWRSNLVNNLSAVLTYSVGAKSPLVCPLPPIVPNFCLPTSVTWWRPIGYQSLTEINNRFHEFEFVS